VYQVSAQICDDSAAITVIELAPLFFGKRCNIESVEISTRAFSSGRGMSIRFLRHLRIALSKSCRMFVAERTKIFSSSMKIVDAAILSGAEKSYPINFFVSAWNF
jgi:hypothetical protein